MLRFSAQRFRTVLYQYRNLAMEACTGDIALQRKERREEAKRAKVKTEVKIPARKLRILALHGGLQNAKDFEKKGRKLWHGIREEAEMEFIDAPFEAVAPPPINPQDIGGIPAWEPKFGYSEGSSQERCPSADTRTWWLWNPDDPGDFRYASHGYHRQGLVYQHLDNSLESVWGFWKEHGPFDGILGFSQGAVMASIFAQWVIQEKRILRPCFLLLHNGFLNPVPINMPEYWCGDQETIDQIRRVFRKGESSYSRESLPPCFPLAAMMSSLEMEVDGDVLDMDALMPLRSQIFAPESFIPSLHLTGDYDNVMPPARSQELANWHAGSSFHVQTGVKHELPQRAEDIGRLRQFLQDQRAKIVSA